ncbi:MAG: TetR/AcrR family transcriptional regulator [Actinomycetota bacterium]
MTPQAAAVDRGAAVRRALRTLVARHGFHGASMSAVAAEAGVATGTAYVHYRSKDDLVFAAYLETKRELGQAAVAGIEPGAPPEQRFRRLWHNVHRHLAGDPDRARFLVQVEWSPYAREAHERALGAADDPLVAEASKPDLAALLAPLQPGVLYDLALGPAVRLVAGGVEIDQAGLDAVAGACWRAVTRG